MTSLARVQSSLDLLCQTAGALEASDGAAVSGPLKNDAEPPHMHRVSPSLTNLAGGAGTAQSPLIDGGSFSRSTSTQYLVGASPSQDSFATYEEEDAAVVVPNRPWALATGPILNVREQYIETLQSSNRNFLPDERPSQSTTMSGIPALLPARTSSFHQPPAYASTAVGTGDGGSKDIQAIDGAHCTADKNTLKKGDSLFIPVSSSNGAPVVALQSAQDLVDQNARLRWDLSAKDKYIESLLAQIDELRGQVTSLKSLPVGKISQIPVEDLLEIMHEYGSEVSEHALPPRKGEVQKASVVRQFRRWNPNFFQYFEYRQGKWVPKLGKLAELQRRARFREAIKGTTPQGAAKPRSAAKRRG